jgi:hemerythrin-like domain-containing protein
MATITESLVSEHGVLSNLFEEIKRLLPEVRTVEEVRLLVRLVEGLLSRHADVEQNLAYAALDHVLAENGQLDRLYEDHQEIDAGLHRAKNATDLYEAMRLLKSGLNASQEHFRREERTVFPMFQKLFGAASLETLGSAVAPRPAAETLGPKRSRAGAKNAFAAPAVGLR